MDVAHDAGCRRCGLPVDFTPRTPLAIGTVFDTPYEKGCVVVGLPDVVGNFDARDSDGVVCSFSEAMVVRVHDA